MGFVWFRPKSHRLPQRKASREKQRPGNPFFPKQPGRRMAGNKHGHKWETRRIRSPGSKSTQREQQ